MSKKPFLVAAMAAALALTAIASPAAAAQSKTNIRWFVGLGTGTNSQQIAVQKKVVDEFNASHPDINLSIEISPDYTTGSTLLSSEIAAGNGPDIIGPVGVGGSNAFASQYADLKPLIDKNKVDLSAYDPSTLALYQTLNGGFSALPFDLFPSATFYNTALFDEAGLNYPPANYGDKYKMPDGTMVDWNYDTLLKISEILTVDANGKDATDPKFDPTKIVQYGLDWGYDAPRLIFTDMQPSAFYDAASNKVAISADWQKAIQWFYDSVWKYHITANATAVGSKLLSPNPFDSGHVGLLISPIWFACCLQDTAGKLKWDLAAVPSSFDGKPHNAVDADTFRLYKGSKNPDAAFTVLQYLLNDAVPELAPAYGAFPALAKYQQGWLDSENKIYPQGVHWQNAIAGLKYTDPVNLHHESNSPNWQQGQNVWSSFISLILSDSGAKINVPTEITKLQSNLQSVVNGTYPTDTPVPPTPVPTAAATAAATKAS
jgi:multiple sugar transport system substrate-binding protein